MGDREERVWSSLSKVRSGKTSQYRKVKRQIPYSANEDEFQISTPTPHFSFQLMYIFPTTFWTINFILSQIQNHLCKPTEGGWRFGICSHSKKCWSHRRQRYFYRSLEIRRIRVSSSDHHGKSMLKRWEEEQKSMGTQREDQRARMKTRMGCFSISVG